MLIKLIVLTLAALATLAVWVAASVYDERKRMDEEIDKILEEIFE